MIKKYKGYLILLAAIIILIVAYLFISRPAKPTNADIEYNDIINISADSIKKIRITNPKDSYTVVYDEEISIAELPDAEISTKNANELKNSLSYIITRENVIENVIDKMEYGLSDAEFFAEITDKKGETIILDLGNRILSQDKYYCSIRGDSNVYVIDEELFSILNRDSSYYRVSEFGTIDFSAVKAVTLEIPGKPLMKFKEIYVPNPDKPHNVFNKLEMTEPYSWPALADEVGKIVDAVSDISVIDYAAENLDNKENYGFNPYTAKITITHDNRTDTLITGNKSDGMIYIIFNNIQKIYGISSEKFDFLDLEAFTYVSNFAFLKNIDTVKNIIYNHNGKETVFSVKKSGEEQYDVSIGGKLVSYNEFQSMYTELISIMLAGGYSGITEGTPFLSYTFEYNDGTSETAEYYKIDDRRAAFSCNGKIQFYVSIATLNEKLSVIDEIINKL